MKMLILVGNIGTGKSTYCLQHTGKYLRINQDELGSRYECIKVCENALKSQIPVIIDRTNINKSQRKFWLDLAKKYNYDVECIVFTLDKEQSINRIINRKNHETINNLTKKQIEEIYDSFAKNYEQPLTNEGFSNIVNIEG